MTYIYYHITYMLFYNYIIEHIIYMYVISKYMVPKITEITKEW